MVLNTGAELRSAFLNGKQVYKHDRHGWCPGRERISVQLKAGENTLVIEAGRRFFVSLTRTADR